MWIKTANFSVLIIFVISSLLHEIGSEKVDKGSGDPLLLTPLIQSHQFERARELALVKLKNVTKKNYLPVDVLSYSGLLTVDPECSSTIFFWFFPATYSSSSAPVILWHGGGPGSSGLSALFSQHGPFLLDEFGALHLRPYPWTLTRSIIYVDSPVGTGFSDHDNRPECYVRSTSTTAKQMVEAIFQFFKLFPEFGENELFLFSGSYGGKFVPAIAYEIHTQNGKASATGNDHINLKGFCIASGFTDPISQIDYGSTYFAAGLIDSKEADYFRQRETLAKSNINSGNWTAAFDIIEPLIIGVDGQRPSYLRTITGITFPFNMAKDWPSDPPQLRRHVEFLNQNAIREAIHVGTNIGGRRKNYTSSSSVVYANFKEDIYQSVKPLFEELLDSGLYRILLVSNQLDLIVPHSSISAFLASLSGKKGFEFKECRAKKWQGQDHGNMTLGYIRELEDRTLAYLFLRNSGHLWVLDQPEVAFQVMTTFTNGNSWGVNNSNI